MLRQILVLGWPALGSLVMLAFTSTPSFAQKAVGTGGDICTIRPDLCDSSLPEPPHKPAPRRLPRAPSAWTASARNCRLATSPYRLEDAGLPVCRSSLAVKKRPLTQHTTWDNTDGDDGTGPQAPTPARSPAGAGAGSLSFDQYMNANAANPALGAKARDQHAFVDTTKPATITFPADGVSTIESTSSSSTPPLTLPGGTSAPLSGGATSGASSTTNPVSPIH